MYISYYIILKGYYYIVKLRLSQRGAKQVLAPHLKRKGYHSAHNPLAHCPAGKHRTILLL